jgi:hypothetical protein
VQENEENQDRDGESCGSEDNDQTKHKDKNVNSNYSKDEILLFIDENNLSETELNWLKSLGPISEKKILDLSKRDR